MALPKIDIPRVDVTLPDGSTVEVRGLTRGEVLSLGDIEDSPQRTEELEVRTLAWATDTPIDETRAWYAAMPFGIVGAVIDEIGRLSGTSAAEGKDSGAAC